jgi:predicted Zn-ribbon and HTH transcriptional regulator
MAAHRKLDQSRVDLCVVALRKGAFMGLDCLIPTTNALRFFETSLNVHANMIQQNGELLPQPASSKRKGNYTGERLKVLRPETYRRVVRLLAEPREHVSIREICRQCRVTDDKVKAVERREAISITARKQALMVQAARIAKLAYDRVEDQIDDAPLPQAVVTAGVFTDKLHLLSGDAAAHAVNVNVNVERVDVVEQFKRLLEAANAAAAQITLKQLALPSDDAIADSGAESPKPASADASRREENAAQKQIGKAK